MSSSNISSLRSVLQLVQNKLSLSFALFYLIFGVTGCFLNILLFSRKQFRRVSCCTYFLAASVAMFIVLGLSSGNNLYTFIYDSPINRILVYCKLWFYLIQAVSLIFRWMLVAACLDRCALSSANARLRRFASVYVARRVVIGIALMWCVLSSPFLFLYGLNDSNYCVVVYGYAPALYVGIFVIITTYMIPVMIMISCVLLIRRNLAEKRQRRHFNVAPQQAINNREDPQLKRDQQALVMLFAQIFLYIILTTPWAIFSIYNAIALNIPNKSADRLAIEQFVFFLTGLIILLFPSMSFYLYTLTSNLFRKELCIMLRPVLCYRYCMVTHQIEPMVTNVPLRNFTQNDS